MKHLNSLAYREATAFAPTRGRGLKLVQSQLDEGVQDVRPHTGAWIETLPPPDRSRGPAVRPHTGAWIETVWFMVAFQGGMVRPHTGAWIETCDKSHISFRVASFAPTRGRGLKLTIRLPGPLKTAGSPPHGGVD